ncbi:hypothetical protein CVT25_001282 [Psilocybe cyanescens]|uniref:Uncharacterized protein n=1 Tax=Psilocybe cyanescens TaxID=93625 RepID=A0A409XEK2_PSICY|nr:hypothetical protein CVT25_001282 [Psilocybe cyanescens]
MDRTLQDDIAEWYKNDFIFLLTHIRQLWMEKLCETEGEGLKVAFDVAQARSKHPRQAIMGRKGIAM